jgi:hypothetical protein
MGETEVVYAVKEFRGVCEIVENKVVSRGPKRTSLASLKNQWNWQRTHDTDRLFFTRQAAIARFIERKEDELEGVEARADELKRALQWAEAERVVSEPEEG